jgi:hypothetical protein
MSDDDVGCWSSTSGTSGASGASSASRASTYQQQLWLLQHHHDVEHEPRKALYEELFMECTAWMEDGDQLIIGINANEDVHSTGAMADFFKLLVRVRPSLTNTARLVPQPPIIGTKSARLY